MREDSVDKSWALLTTVQIVGMTQFVDSSLDMTNFIYSRTVQIVDMTHFVDVDSLFGH